MHRLAPVSIRNKFVALIIVMSAIPFSFIVYSLGTEQTRQANEALHSTVDHTEQTAKLLTQTVSNTQLLLSLLARLPIVQSHDVNSTNRFLLDLVTAYPQYSSFFIVDRNGDRWATTNKLSGAVSYSDRKYFINAISSGQFSSGEYAIGKVKKKPVFSFALPIKDGAGSITGVIVATLELDGLQSVIAKDYGASHESLVVTDHKGITLINSSDASLEGRPENADIFTRMQEGPNSKTLQLETADSPLTKVISYQKLSLPGETSPYMYVRLEVDKKLLLKDSYNKFILNLAVLLCTMLASVAVYYRISKRYMLDPVDERERRHKVLFDTSPIGIMYQDPNGAVVAHNISASRIADSLKVTDETGAFSGATPRFIHEDGEPYPVDTHPGMEVITTGSSIVNKIMGVVEPTGGSCNWLKINAIPMFRNDEKKPYMAYSFIEDITWQREQEKERLAIERQLLNTQKLESLGVMAGGIAHDFNNLLQVILGNLELASRATPDAATQKLISGAIISGRQAAHLTNLMLTYVGNRHLIKRSLSLNNIVRDNAEILRSAISSSIIIETCFSEDLPHFLGDEGQVQQVVMNLLTNAAESIENLSGHVKLTTGTIFCDEQSLADSLLNEKAEPGNYVYLKVCDSGCGMSRETIKRIFDPFFTTKFTGRGLGMSAVMGIVKAHSGALFVTSAPDRGTSFRVLFPLQASAEPVLPDVSAESHAATSESLFAGVALVVDDEKPVLKICAKMVKLFGFTVLTASDGMEAVAKFRENADKITIVIMDLTMPVMDGIGAMNEIYEIRPDAKVFLSSGFNDDDIDNRIHERGPSGFIRKPYSMNELERELRRVMPEN